MSVYTQLDSKQFDSILSQYNLGRLHAFEGIAAGIENTNYKITLNTSNGTAIYFLTIFEQLHKQELNFFIPFLSHLKTKGCALPAPKANINGEFLFQVGEKWGVIFECLSGHHLDDINTDHAQTIGQELARIHQSAQSFAQAPANPRGFYWLQKQASCDTLEIPDADRTLLQSHLKTMQGLWQQWNGHPQLTKSFIHGDLFVDNCLFLDNGQLSGVIDFYAGGFDYCIYDIAICIMAWGKTDNATINPAIADAIVAGYESVRALTRDEKHYLPDFLRLAVLRFWVSRLIAKTQQQGAALTTVKNPDDMKALLVNLK
ncbi:homoserine kinase [Bermanella sp. WJH001]|uniref:homoserine kinase n=1 Tax=Bermanella sp. WJH001 TaxID=3048005 RepID=UPI0024BDA003|nr:homoserine kinase [Bermanella sp. WJH001]MDJ1538904.1 homoserine kinase [Bermanella sp. WJH001]